MSDGCGSKLTVSDAASQPDRQRSARADRDADVIAAAQAGDFRAFEELVNRSEKRIYRIVLNITGSPDDAEDALQETFLKAFKHLGDFREESRFHTWLVRIAINEGLMRLRKRRSDKSVPMEDTVDDGSEVNSREFADWRPGPEQIFEQAEMRTILERALQALPSHQRIVFWLRHVEACSTKEAADIMNVTVTTAKGRLHRARLRLRENLSIIFRHEERCEAKKMGFIERPCSA